MQEIKLNCKKYEVGDRVQIRLDLRAGNSYDGVCMNAAGEMDHWCGKVMTIATVNTKYVLKYSMVEDQGDSCGSSGWNWSHSMIEAKLIEQEVYTPIKKLKSNRFNLRG